MGRVGILSYLIARIGRRTDVAWISDAKMHCCEDFESVPKLCQQCMEPK